MTNGVAGLRVFVAEDEFHVLQLIEDMLVELGCTVVDSVSSVRAALERVATIDADVAVLDVNLRGTPIFPVAQILRDRRIPILFSTGYGTAGIAPEWQGYPVIQKPFAIGGFGTAIAQIAALAGPATAPRLRQP